MTLKKKKRKKFQNLTHIPTLKLNRMTLPTKIQFNLQEKLCNKTICLKLENNKNLYMEKYDGNIIVYHRGIVYPDKKC